MALERTNSETNQAVGWKATDGRYLALNHGLERITGYEVPERLDSSAFWRALMPPEDAAQYERAFQEGVEKRQSTVIAYRMYHQSGDLLSLQSQLHYCEHPEHGHGFFCVDQPQTATEPRAHQRPTDDYYQKLLHTRGAYIIRTDLDGCYTFASASFIKKFRLDRSPIVGTDSMQDIHPDDHGRCIETVYQCLEQPNVAHQVELRKPRPGGGFFFTLWEFVGLPDANGQTVEIQCVGIDQTELRNKERQLQERESYYRFLFDQVRELVAVEDVNGLIIDASAGAKPLLGLRGHRLIGRKLEDYVAHEDGPAYTQTRDQVHQEARAQEGNFRFVHREGFPVWLNVLFTPMLDAQGNVERILTSARNISQIMQRNLQLKKSRSRLKDAQTAGGYFAWEYDIQDDRLEWEDGFPDAFQHVETPSALNTWTRLLAAIDPIDRPPVQEAFENLVHHGLAVDLEFQLATTGPALYVLRWMGQRIQDEASGQYRLVGLIKDVTGENELHRKLELQNDQLELFFNTSLYGFFFMMLDEPVDWHGASEAEKEHLLDYVFEHQRITRANDAMLNQYRMAPEDFYGCTPRDFFAHDLEYGRQVWRAFFDQGYLKIDTQEKKADGADMWVEGEYRCFYDADGRIKGHFGIQQDVTETRRAQQKLAANEQRLRKMTDRLPGVLFQFMVQKDGSWVIPHVSGPAQEFFGVAAADMLQDAQEAFRYLHPEDAPALSASIEHAVETMEPWQLDFRIQHPQRGLLWLRGNSTLEALEEGVLAHGFITDITERKAQRLAMEQSRARLNKLADRVPGALFEAQMTAQGALQFTYISEGILELNPGIKVEDLYRDGWEAFSYISKQDRERAVQAMQTARQRLELGDLEYRVHQPDGQWAWHRATAMPEARPDGTTVWYGIFQDITQTKRTEQELDRLAEVTRNTSDAILVCNEEAQIQWGNQSVLDFLGRSLEQIVGSPLYNVFPMDQAEPEAVAELDQRIRDKRSCKGALKLTGPQHEALWMDYILKPVQDQQGQFQYHILGLRDVTGLIRKQTELEELLTLSTDQNKRLENFAHIVSHNIRSHSSNLSGLLELIHDEESREEREQYIHLLGETVDKLEETIQYLNEVITIHSNLNQSKTHLPLHKYVDSTLSLLQQDVERHRVHIEKDIPEHFTVRAIPAYLESILLNLISNAIKYRDPERPPRVRIFGRCDTHYSVIGVSDNGLGIDLSRYRDHLFGMYKTFHINPEARGMGLFIVKNQVEALGGSIDVNSTPGEGSTFKVYLYD